MRRAATLLSSRAAGLPVHAFARGSSAVITPSFGLAARASSNAATDRWSHPATYEQTRLPIDEASTLPGAVYQDETFFNLEKERVFHSSWVAAAELCDLSEPGDVVPATVGGAPVVLANDKGTIRAFHNVCSHRGAQLVSERCTKRRTILCPYHRWGYALDGRLVGTPAFDADDSGKNIPQALREKFRTHHVKNFAKESMGLKPIRVDTALGLVFVNMNGEAPPLDVWFGDLLPTLADWETATAAGQLTATHRKTYEVDSNWKALVENYLEYYHLPAVHPALCDVSGVDEHRRNQGTGMYLGFRTDPLTQGGTAIDPGRLPPFPPLRAFRTKKAYHLALFPNTFFSLYPDAFFRVVLSPKSVGKTVEHATLLTHKAALDAPNSKFIMDEVFAFWDNVNTEDIGICEAVQKGTAAPVYEGGRFSFRFEEPVHRFQNMVIDKMLPQEETRYRIPEGDKDAWLADTDQVGAPEITVTVPPAPEKQEL